MRIHLIAICGTGMASLAGLLKAKGHMVSGSDTNVYPPMSDQLAAMGIDIRMGYLPENIEATKPDMVVVGNAISKNNPEVLEVQHRGLPLLSMAQALADFFITDRSSIVVAGTHGKTTTSGLLAWLLEDAGRSPGFFVGGILKNFEKSYQLGSGPEVILEGDEYDTAFFDKGPKFLHYRPHRLILNSVEFDHADIYRDLDHVMEAFGKLVALVPAEGLIVADGENENVLKLIRTARCRILTCGVDDGTFSTTDYSARDVKYGPISTEFTLISKDREIGKFESPMPGRHNLKNLIADIVVALDLGILPEKIQDSVKKFQGLKRRQEVLGIFRGVTLIDDFAHHPTAIRETLAALRARYDGRKLWAIFEPRSNTTRRNVFQKDFLKAFDGADEILFAAPFQPEKIPEADRLHPEDVVKGLQAAGRKARYVPEVDAITAVIAQEAREGDVICFMSNGGFGGIYQKTIDALERTTA